MTLPTSYEAWREMEDERNSFPMTMAEESAYQHMAFGTCSFDCARCQPPEPVCYTCGAYDYSECHCVSLTHPTRPWAIRWDNGTVRYYPASGQPACDPHTGKTLPISLEKVYDPFSGKWWSGDSMEPPF